MRTIRDVGRISFVILSLSLVFGCATTRFTQDAAQVRALKGVAVVADVTMTRGRTLKPDTLSLSENEGIAKEVAARAADLLREKGYAVTGEPAYTVGLSGTGGREVEVVNDAGAESVDSPPFIGGPSGGMEKDAAARLYLKAGEESVGSDDNPYGEVPVFVVSAGGRFISGGAVAGNVGKAAVNTVIFAGAMMAAAFGGNVGDVPTMEMDKDMAWLTFRLFDPATGALIWKDAYKDSGNPDSANFLKQLEKMMKKLPQAGG